MNGTKGGMKKSPSPGTWIGAGSGDISPGAVGWAKVPRP